MVEARNRVGGRVLSFSDLVPGKNVEGGGELIGSNHPAWLAYAKQFGLSFLDVGEEDLEAPIVLNGKKVTAEQSEQLWEEMEKVFNTIVTDAAKVDADEPWKAAGAEALDKRTIADWINKQSASPLCTSALHTMMMADNGVVTEWQSYLGNLAMVKGGGLEKYWTESEVYRCRGGNQQLATKLVAAIGAARVLTRMPVRALALTERGARVTLGSGKVLEAEHVLLTAPPSVWNKIAIDPVLPAALAPQMGTNVKYLMSLKSPVWRRTELVAGSAVGRSGVDDLALDRGAEGPRRSADRVLGRTGRRRVPRLDCGPARSQLPGRAQQGVSRHHRELRPRTLHGLAVRSLEQGLGTRSRRRARSPRRARPCGRGSAGCTSPASTAATRSWATWKARSIPERPRRSALRKEMEL